MTRKAILLLAVCSWGPTRAGGQQTAGSLWTDRGPFLHLFSDVKARGVGDIVVIRIVENVSARQSADASSSREAGASVGISNLFGLETRVPSSVPLDSLFGGESKNEFEGAGSTSRRAVLTATITATVREVLPGGNLVIEARRQIQVNGERETLTLRGIVRPEDIGPSNAVLSTAIADLVLEYGGKGVIGANLKPSFLFRILRFIF